LPDQKITSVDVVIAIEIAGPRDCDRKILIDGNIVLSLYAPVGPLDVELVANRSRANPKMHRQIALIEGVGFTP
jgi:hypothetical protein